MKFPKMPLNEESAFGGDPGLLQRQYRRFMKREKVQKGYRQMQRGGGGARERSRRADQIQRGFIRVN